MTPPNVVRQFAYLLLSGDDLAAVAADHICWRGPEACPICRMRRGEPLLTDLEPWTEQPLATRICRSMFKGQVQRLEQLHEIQAERHAARSAMTATATSTTREVKKHMAKVAAQTDAVRRYLHRQRIRLVANGNNATPAIDGRRGRWT